MKTNPIYFQPQNIEEAVNLASKHVDHFSYLAGGTDVWVNRFQGNNWASCIIDLSGITEMQNVTVEGETLRIGALIKLDQLQNITEIETNFPVLLEAAHAVGSPVIRKMGTIGGNILCENRCMYYNQSFFWREAVDFCLKSGGDLCIATGGPKACFSEFVSDTAPALISMDARVEIIDADGEAISRLEDIYTGDGVNPRKLSRTAIVKTILLPLNREFRSVFKKLRPRNSTDFTSLTTAVSVDKEGKMKIALSGVSPKPVVIDSNIEAEQELIIKEALKLCKTVENDIYPRTYRRKMIELFLRKSFEELSKG